MKYIERSKGYPGNRTGYLGNKIKFLDYGNSLYIPVFNFGKRIITDAMGRRPVSRRFFFAVEIEWSNIKCDLARLFRR